MDGGERCNGSEGVPLCRIPKMLRMSDMPYNRHGTSNARNACAWRIYAPTIHTYAAALRYINSGIFR